MRKLVSLSITCCFMFACGLEGPVNGADDTNKEVAEQLTNSFSILSGNKQEGNINEALPLPLTISLKNPNAEPIEDANIRFSVIAGTATISDTDLETDQNGEAGVTVTLGSVGGTSRILARLLPDPDQNPNHSLHFDVTAFGPEKLSIVSGDAQTQMVSLTLPEELVVQAVDQFNEPMKNVSIVYEVITGSASLSKINDQTNTEGKSSVSVQLGTEAGPVEIKATLLPDPGDDPNRNRVFVISAAPGAPNQYVISNGGDDCYEIDEEDMWQVALIDEYGNGLSKTIEITPSNLLVSNAQGHFVSIPVTRETENNTGFFSFSVKTLNSPSSGSITLNADGFVRAYSVEYHEPIWWDSGWPSSWIQFNGESARVPDATLYINGCDPLQGIPIYYHLVLDPGYGTGIKGYSTTDEFGWFQSPDTTNLNCGTSNENTFTWLYEATYNNQEYPIEFHIRCPNAP